MWRALSSGQKQLLPRLSILMEAVQVVRVPAGGSRKSVWIRDTCIKHTQSRRTTGSLHQIPHWLKTLTSSHKTQHSPGRCSRSRRLYTEPDHTHTHTHKTTEELNMSSNGQLNGGSRDAPGRRGSAAAACRRTPQFWPSYWTGSHDPETNTQHQHSRGSDRTSDSELSSSALSVLIE